LDDLLSMDEAALMRIPNFGNGCMIEIYRMLSLRGLNLVRRCSQCGQLLPDSDQRSVT
jgi:DNA-directed RNA polymerase alpha subunit